MRDENKQQNSGNSAIQIYGDNNTIHNHQHDHTVHAHGPLHVHTHVERPLYALQAPPAPPARYRHRNPVGPEITPAQKDLLAMMRPLPKPARIAVLEYMRAEFGTGLVIALAPPELQRARQAVLDARRAAGV
jgi:hypothetical protein